MTEKELRRLGRRALIEILYEQQKQCEQLRAENEQLRAKLAERTLKLADVGSIAEASLRLNGVFEAAQAAAEQYLQSVRALTEQKRESAAEKKEDTDAHCDSGI